MKIKLFLIFFLLLSFIGCKSHSITLIGDSFLLNNIEKSYTNSEFLFSKTTSKNIYYCLDKNAVSIENKYKINELIKKSSKLVISYGIFDILPLFDFSNKQISFEEEQVKEKMEIIDYYIYQSFQIVNELIDSKKVYIIKQYNPLTNDFSNINELEKCLNQLNDILLEYSRLYNFNFIEIDGYKDLLLDDFILDSSIGDEINKKMQ